ncbi:hypothetical protein C0216_07015 [Streptomyces globosus]|uniref:Resolvase/invertase-type recombinase catalytic domain-containing protein n=1 Tax=Streptomyces globosus TaxID=68209 RepID=A0A344TX66_9ACTN|nr:hypothetical protein [Streptomyces globosus]AXE23237.1 hypothetical protein C0216_07015 [Streptomyces globosus]
MERITEHREIGEVHVYGYLRHTTGSAARHTALVDSVAEYCLHHELTLHGVFTERDVTTNPLATAFIGLLDVLALAGTYGVVVPSRSHLGPKGLAAERERRIEEAGASLIVVRGSSPRQGRERPAEAQSVVRQRGGV